MLNHDSLFFIALTLTALAIWEAAKYVVRLYQENKALKKQLDERHELMSEQILELYTRRVDTAYKLRELALMEHLGAEFEANPAMVARIVGKFVAEQKKEARSGSKSKN